MKTINCGISKVANGYALDTTEGYYVFEGNGALERLGEKIGGLLNPSKPVKENESPRKFKVGQIWESKSGKQMEISRVEKDTVVIPYPVHIKYLDGSGEGTRTLDGVYMINNPTHHLNLETLIKDVE